MNKQMRKWSRSYSCQQCRNCGALVEKTDGCAEVTCICGETWCWTCGFPMENWMHYSLFANGILCNFINSFLMGYELTIHLNWLLRLFIFLFLISMFPLCFFLYTLGFTLKEFFTISRLNDPSCVMSPYHQHNILILITIIFPVTLSVTVFCLCLSIVMSLLVTVLVSISLVFKMVVVLPKVVVRTMTVKYNQNA